MVVPRDQKVCIPDVRFRQLARSLPRLAAGEEQGKRGACVIGNEGRLHSINKVDTDVWGKRLVIVPYVDLVTCSWGQISMPAQGLIVRIVPCVGCKQPTIYGGCVDAYDQCCGMPTGTRDKYSMAGHRLWVHRPKVRKPNEVLGGPSRL